MGLCANRVVRGTACISDQALEWLKGDKPVNEHEKELTATIVEIFDRLPENKQQRLLGVAEGMDMAATTAGQKGSGER